MSRVISTDAQGNQRYFRCGVEVTAAEFHGKKPHKTASQIVGTGNFLRPVVSDALGVHTSQIPEAIKEARKRGCTVDFDESGRPKFTDSRTFRKYAKRHGFVHKGYF